MRSRRPECLKSTCRVRGSPVELSCRSWGGQRGQVLAAVPRSIALTTTVTRGVHSETIMTPPSPLEARLARVERALAVLAAEVSAIRAELQLPASAPVASEAPAGDA